MTQLDMTPGAQIPVMNVGTQQTAVTQALSSAAYRDGDFAELVEKLPGVKRKDGKWALFRPSAGEAFSRALIDRTIPGKRNPLVPSFGTDVRMVVEHCLAAQDLREARDRKLTTVMLVCGVLFLPGLLIWLAAFQARAYLQKNGPSAREGFLGTLALLLAFGIAILFALRPPFGGVWGMYFRIVMLVPAAGWFWARRIALQSVIDLRSRWQALVEGSTIAAVVPKAVPRDHLDRKANDLKASLDRLTAEQDTNIQHYAGAKGILGIGTRWSEFVLSEDLHPAEGHDDFRAFHLYDLVRKITDRLGRLASSEVPGGAMPKPAILQWVVQAIPEGADEIGRPGGSEMDGYRMRDFAVQDLANKQSMGGDSRHRVAIQYVLHKGQLVSTMVVEIRVLHSNLRVTVTGHALGPVNGFFTTKPKPKEKDVPKPVRFWENRTVQLPLVNDDEVVRQAVRAPFHKLPTLLTWLGGGIGLPEPFSLRSSWVDRSWNSRFMADDSIHAATPVVNAVQAATIQFLEEHDISVERFTNRSNILKSEMQGTRPFKADEYPV